MCTPLDHIYPWTTLISGACTPICKEHKRSHLELKKIKKQDEFTTKHPEGNKKEPPGRLLRLRYLASKL